MTQNLLIPLSSPKEDRLFSGMWLRWSALNTAERFVCTNLVLLPAWWISGLMDYMPLLMLTGIALYEWQRYGKIRLKKPSIAVLALFAFFAYEFVDAFLLYHNAHPSVVSRNTLTFNELIKTTFEFALPCLVWYVQSNNIRVRPQAVAWACTVLVIQTIVAWAVVQFVFPNAFIRPPRSLYGVLTGKSSVYTDGLGKTNYLLFYDENRRFGFFFGDQQTCVAFLGFIGLLALDIKNRLWSVLLLAACVALMIPPGSRSVWVAFPAILFVRFLLTTGKVGGTWFLFALIALLSFGTLSLPPATQFIADMTGNTATAVGEYREGSTEVRSEIYKQTLKRVLDKPLFGHKVTGVADDSPHLDGGGDVAYKVGTHSVILGRLLYQNGLIGTGIFATFWLSLIVWLYNTRSGRPMCWFPTLLLFTLMSSFTFFHNTYIMGTLLCMVLRDRTKSHKTF